MLTFIEAGTEQAADLGYGDEAYFAALEAKLDAVAKAWRTLPAEVRALATPRLACVQQRSEDIGWGYGDYVREVVARLTRPSRSEGDAGQMKVARWPD